MNEESMRGRRVGKQQKDVEEIEQIVKKFDEIVRSHDGQQDVVRRDHRRPAEDDQRQGVAGQSDNADDRVDDQPGDETRRLVELGVRRRFGGRCELARGHRRRRRRCVNIHRHQRTAGARA